VLSEMSKYEVGSVQGRFQPGSNNQVLENKLGITAGWATCMHGRVMNAQ